MTFSFKPAVREQVSLLVALAGASGSGKTMSALRLAQGMAPTGKIAFIDTEARRGLHYADKFTFMHADMKPPFRPERFTEGVDAAVAAGAEVVVIDSFSLEYDGVGGIMEWADELAEKGVKSPGNWKEPKLAHRKMMNSLLQCRASLIFCLRADEKIEIVRDGGKTQVRPLGWMPICEKRFAYEMTASFTLTPDAPGRVNTHLPHKLQEQHRPMFPEGEFITEQSGRLLAEWAAGGSPKLNDDLANLMAEGAEKAAAGMVELGEWWKLLTPEWRAAIGKSQLEAWKKIAEMTNCPPATAANV